jgi:hypothetical protein
MCDTNPLPVTKPDKTLSGSGNRGSMVTNKLLAQDAMRTARKAAGASAATGAIAAGAILLLGGCGLSTLTSGLGGFGGTAAKAPAETAKGGVSEERLLTAAKANGTDAQSTDVGEVAHGCPKFLVWSRDNSLTIYETGRVGDGLAVMHRGEVTQTARECEVEPGKVTVKYGFSGRVLLGPRGKTGNVTLPLTVFVTDAKRERVTAEKMKVDVAVAVDNPIGYFSVVKSVSFKVPVGTRPGEFEVYVGFERNVPGAG